MGVPLLLASPISFEATAQGRQTINIDKFYYVGRGKRENHRLSPIIKPITSNKPHYHYKTQHDRTWFDFCNSLKRILKVVDLPPIPQNVGRTPEGLRSTLGDGGEQAHTQARRPYFCPNGFQVSRPPWNGILSTYYRKSDTSILVHYNF